MQRQRALQLVFVCLVFSLFFVGCAPKINPTYFDKSIWSAEMKEIVVLPVVDIRKDKSLVLSEGWPQDAFIAYFRSAGLKFYYMPQITDFKDKKGYEVYLAKDYGGIKEISEDDILDADPSWIKRLGPDASQWVLLFVLEDLANRKTFGVAAMAECSGYLFDKTSGKVVWKHESVGEVSVGGLQGLMMAKKGPTLAVNTCFLQVFQQLPPRGYNVKKQITTQ